MAVAQANLINFNTCDSGALSQPFAPWGDHSSYELAPGGDFESASAPWTLSGGAKVVSGSEPYAATGTRGSSSLSLPAGSTAQSPSTCVDASDPTIRFFVGGTGTVAVSVLYDGVAVPTGVVAAAGTWTPTPALLTGSLLGLASGGKVSVVLTGLTGSPQVDDVFIDPWGRD